MNPAPDRSSQSWSETAREARTTAWSRFWAVGIPVSTIAVALVWLVDAPEVLRSSITIWFIAICPGMAAVRLLHLGRPILEIMLAIAVSLALASVVPGIFIYLAAWSPAWSLTVLVGIAATPSLWNLAIAATRRRHGAPDRTRRPFVVAGPESEAPPVRAPDASPGIRGQKVPLEGFAESESTGSLRSAFDLLIGDLAERRQRGE
jgi:hypothetical protein